MGLRAIEKPDNGLITVFGTLALMLWLVIFLGIAALASLNFGDEPVSYPTAYVLGIGAALLFGLLAGGSIVRVASQGEIYWWRGVQFCALFLVVTHGLVIWLVFNWSHILSLMSHAIDRLGLTSFNDYVVTGYAFFLWLFPLSAPFLEMMIRSFRRAWQQNRTGTYTR